MEDLDQRLARLIAPLEQELDQLGARRQHLTEERAQVDRDMARINRALKPLRGEDTPKKKVAKTAAKKNISDERVKEIEAAIHQLAKGGEFVTVPMLADYLPISKKQIQTGINQLRTQQRVRRAGRADNGGQKGLGPYQYALMSTEGVNDGRRTRQPA